MRLVTLALSGAVVVATIAISSVAQSACQFRYSDNIRTGIIDPEIRRRLGDNAGPGALAINDSNPFVVVHGDNVELTFDPGRVDLLDPPSFQVLLSECGRKLAGSRLHWFPGTGVTGRWISPGEEWPADEGERVGQGRQPPVSD